MIILGLASTPAGEAAAALLVDQSLVAIADEASLTRSESSEHRLPWAAAHYCLRQGGLEAAQIDAIATTNAGTGSFASGLWQVFTHAGNHSPYQGFLGVWHALQQKIYQQRAQQILLQQLGLQHRPMVGVTRALAHASAGHYLGNSPDNALFISDIMGYEGAQAGTLHNGRIQVLDRHKHADSLSWLMQGMGSYLGFAPECAAEGIALLARHGDPLRYDLQRLFQPYRDGWRINAALLDPTGRHGWQQAGHHYPFTQKLVDWLGPPATEAPALDPHAHYAAALCRLVEHRLSTHHKQIQALATTTGHVANGHQLLFAGDAANSRWLPQRWEQQGGMLHAAPAGNAAMAAAGAAAWVAAQHGIRPEAMSHAQWGPGFLSEECIAACKRHRSRPAFEIIKDPAKKVARLLAEGHGVAWLQGRQEITPWPLGARALLYAPTSQQRPLRCAKTDNRWTGHPLTTLSVKAAQQTRYCSDARIATFAERYATLPPEIQTWLPLDLQLDGAAPLHAVEKSVTPRLHALLDELEKLTGHGMVAQLPLLTPQQTHACSPTDAIDAWLNSSADHLVMEEVWVKRVR